MNLLIITHHYEPELGAPQRRWSALVERWRAQGHSVTICCPPPHYPDYQSTEQLRFHAKKPFRREQGNYGETLIRVPYLLHGYRTLPRATDQLIAATGSILYILVHHSPITRFCAKLTGQGNSSEQEFDAVISTIPGLPSLFAGHIISRFLGIKHIAEMRDAWPDVITGDLNSQIRRIPMHKRILKKTVYHLVTHCQKAADAAVVTTHWFGTVLDQRGVKKVIVIPNGAEPSQFSECKPLELSQCLNRELRLQYLGTIGRSQGLQTALDALEILRKNRPDIKIKMRIIGEGAERPRLEQLSQERNLPVEFMDPIAREELARSYEWADIELVCLRKTKPFAWTIPSKIFELLATYRRIIASLEGSAAAVLKRSKVATVVPPEDAKALAQELEKIADDRSLLQVGDSGVKLLIDEFSYDQMADKYQKALDEICQDRF